MASIYESFSIQNVSTKGPLTLMWLQKTNTLVPYCVLSCMDMSTKIKQHVIGSLSLFNLLIHDCLCLISLKIAEMFLNGFGKGTVLPSFD